MNAPERLRKVQPNNWSTRKRPGKSAPSQGLDTLTLGCLPLSRCGSAAVAFLATPIYESMTDSSDPTTQQNSTPVEIDHFHPSANSTRYVTPPRGGGLSTTPLVELGRFGRKGWKRLSQALIRADSIERGQKYPVAVGLTRVNGGGVK
jgi:hypothetical protein